MSNSPMFPTNNIGTRIPHGVSSDSSVNSGYRRNRPEEKVAKAFLKGISPLDFEAPPFLAAMRDSPLVLRRRFLSLVVCLIRLWSQKFDDALWMDEDELEFLVQAKRMQDALLPFYPNGLE